MRFIDEVKISISSGRGGDGRSGFRREKFVPYGGPDGGNGGNGGDIYFQGNQGLNTLVQFRGKKHYSAQNGQNGSGHQRNGASGNDLIIQVPVGTIIKNTLNHQTIADITKNKQKILVAKGGKGGLGNINFKSSVNQAPRKFTYGQEGQTFYLELELKLLADIALIGLPNAGKSTCISMISAARPKISDYTFTTLEPNLGVVKISNENSFVVADIPGLIENASQGKGLGIKFLKHIERTKAFVHLIDISWCIDQFEAFEQYVIIREELGKYNKKLLSKKEIVCLTKIDTLSDEDTKNYVTFFEEQLQQDVLPISALAHKNIQTLKSLMFQTLQQIP